MPATSEGAAVAAAYSVTGGAWQAGPGRIYDRLAEVLVATCPDGVRGRAALDLGAGTGAASRALLAAGARSVVAVDAACGMLTFDAAARPPAVAGDARRLPFADASFDVVVAAFSLNHLDDPAVGLREAGRVLRAGGIVLASAYADDDGHPVKQAVEWACAARGWVRPPWATWLVDEATPCLGTIDHATKAVTAAGLQPLAVEALQVAFPELDAEALVEWRLGMAAVAPFVATLTPVGRAALVADAIARLGPDAGPLTRSVIQLSGGRSAR